MEAVKRIRNERGLSQRELAKRAGLNTVTLVRLEKGVGSPQVDTLEKLAEALGVPIVAFFDEESADPKAQAPLQQPDLDAAAVGQEDDSEDRLVMRQGYEQAFSSAHKKLRNDLLSLDTADPQNSEALFALWTLASMSAMQAHALSNSEEFLQEGEEESIAERRALRGFLEAADSLSETAAAIGELIESQDTQESKIVSLVERRRRKAG